ncbi:MAG: nuclear transport factor 2 family protein [Terriglobia bacterium]
MRSVSGQELSAAPTHSTRSQKERRSWSSEQDRLSSAEMTRENTRIVRRGKLAWAVYQWRFAAVSAGQAVGTQGHTTLILEKRGRNWVIVHNHTSAIGPGAAREESSESPSP